MVISRSILLVTITVSGKIYGGNQNIRYALNNFFKYSAVYETIWKSIVEPGRPKMTIWSTPIACLLSLQTHTQNM